MLNQVGSTITYTGIVRLCAPDYASQTMRPSGYTDNGGCRCLCPTRSGTKATFVPYKSTKSHQVTTSSSMHWVLDELLLY